MIEPMLASDEPLRLRALRDLRQLDTPLEDRFERITRVAQRLLDAPIAAISLVDADRQWFKSIQGLDVCETTRAVSFCGHAILRPEPMIVEDARTDPRFYDNPLVLGDPHIVFYAGCPIQSHDGSNVATLCVVDHRPREMSAQDIESLRDLAAIAQSELNSAMQSSVQRELIAQIDAMSRHASVDSLTRVWNRDAIFELLDIECAGVGPEERGVCVLMVDIDHFKVINDTHGHACGDEVLQRVAKRLLGAIRPVDSLGRYGGEEFMVVLGGCAGLEAGRMIAERVRERVGACSFATEFGEIDATVSVGLAYYEHATPSMGPDIVRAADEMLYRAKRTGRNRVEAGRFEPGRPPIESKAA